MRRGEYELGENMVKGRMVGWEQSKTSIRLPSAQKKKHNNNKEEVEKTLRTEEKPTFGFFLSHLYRTWDFRGLAFPFGRTMQLCGVGGDRSDELEGAITALIPPIVEGNENKGKPLTGASTKLDAVKRQ